MNFTTLSPDEMERRRKASCEEMERRERAEFEARYQELCDLDYWTYGQRCCGCDYWQSRAGWSGECTANGLVSGAEVCRSVGIHCPSAELLKTPGFPYTKGKDWCGKFKDDFDWSTLPRDYLERIGAMKNGVLRSKPRDRCDR